MSIVAHGVYTTFWRAVNTAAYSRRVPECILSGQCLPNHVSKSSSKQEFNAGSPMRPLLGRNPVTVLVHSQPLGTCTRALYHVLIHACLLCVLLCTMS